jgi:hypothetical protein
MLPREYLITLAKRHVEHGRQRIDRQREVVNNLKLAGLETKINEDVLRLFERQQAKFQDHYDGLMRGG